MDLDLTGPLSPLGLPAPFWFIQFFKVLGFALHSVPMNLWYAGLILAAIFGMAGSANARRFSGRLMKQMPFVIAFGVNLGIVPLLFTQVAYYQVFYPSTILMAWLWLSIIGMLLVAYYGVYLYAILMQQSTGLNNRLMWLARLSGWVSALLFIAIGFVFASNFSLMTNLGAWQGLWKTTSIAGAPLGIALNIADPTLLPRWLMLFGLALTTVAAYVVVDAAFFAGSESSEYRRWAQGFALKLSTVGIVWFAVTGSWYILTLRGDVLVALFSMPMVMLTALTAIAPGLTWLLILAQRNGIFRRLAFLTGAVQFGVLALNATSRQVVQSLELTRYLDVAAQPEQLQLSPLVVFLLLFVAGLGVLAWMVKKVVEAGKTPTQTWVQGPRTPRAQPEIIRRG